MTDDTDPTDETTTDAARTEPTTDAARTEPTTEAEASGGGRSDSPDPDQAALAAHTHSLTGSDPGLTHRADRDLEPLGGAMADARVVALGEATHGTREFFRAKHRLVQHLVEEQGVRAFAMEANLPEARALDRYVTHGEGDPAEGLAGLGFWTWQTEAVLALLEWLREFNRNRPLADCVRFYGFDCQYTQGAVEFLSDFIDRVDPDLLPELRRDLAVAADDRRNPGGDTEPLARADAAESLVERLGGWLDTLDSDASNAAADGPGRDLAFARRCVEVLGQAAAYKRAGVAWQEADDEEATERFLRVRDRAMADNVEWVLDQAPGDRVVCWAHDAHVTRTKHRMRDPDSDAAARSMGNHLAERLGSDYYALGFAFGRGSFRAVGPAEDGDGRTIRAFAVDGPPEGTLEAGLARLDHEQAFLDLRSARQDEALAAWLAGPLAHRSLGATYDPADPERTMTEYDYTAAFDGLWYVEETTAARPLSD